MTEAAPPDAAARERIGRDLTSTLFVEAGAGSGKTSALVGRVVALVSNGEAELSEIAAITFTEKAAAELRQRIREELDESVLEHTGTEVASRCRNALDQLDAAAIGTLHAFARRLLSEHPLEAQLPPRIDVLDEVASRVAFEQRWATFQDELLADVTMERPLLLFLSCGAKISALRAIAERFEDNWDLVEERVPPTWEEPPKAAELLPDASGPLAGIESLHTGDSTDSLFVRLGVIRQYLEELCSLEEYELVERLDPESRSKLAVTRCGQAGEWSDIAAARAQVQALGSDLEGVWKEITNACAKAIGSAIRSFTIRSAAERRQSGQLAFHDLLVLARALLRDNTRGPVVRRALHNRYRRILLDEFQDTDPIQIELAVRIAAAAPESEEAGGGTWDEVPVAPGHLFIVGDPKQSIYRFRRADVSTFVAASRHFGKDGGYLALTANFRTAEAVIDWLNTVFDVLIEEKDGAPGEPSQPAYIPLSATRPVAPAGPPVAVLGREAHAEGKADDVRTAEAGEVASVVLRAIHEPWLVRDDSGGWRAPALGDIAILLPSRTPLPFLEDALEKARIPFRTESSSLVYATRAVRDVLMVLRAVDDPTNYLHVVAALRSPLFGCGDDDLYRFKVGRKGVWSYLSRQPDTVPPEDPVRLGLEALRALYEERDFSVPSELLSKIAARRRAFELGAAEGRPKDVWRRLRFVIDQARAWSDSVGGNLRQYLAWVVQQSADGARAPEAILPETDDDAVRIMTIHAAKGLEFPITIVAGMSTCPRGAHSAVRVSFPRGGGVAYRLSSSFSSEEYEATKPLDEQMDTDERIRLLYVACTRARDHLVVSLHRKVRKSEPSDDNKRTNAELLLRGIGSMLPELPDAVGEGPVPDVVVSPATPPPPLAHWEEERTRALENAGRPGTVSATALSDEAEPDVEEERSHGLEKRPRDLDLPPWLKGRYGSAVGRAVHGVLQMIDLSSGGGLDDLVAAQCEAEAVTEKAEEVAQLARAALGSPTVRAAAAAEHWREVYVASPVEGRLLEGYVDLLYRSTLGLVVVDYKTASTGDAAEIDRRADSYRNQGAAYALAVAAATGEEVVGVTFVFLTPLGATERHLDGLEGAVSHVADLVASGGEVVLA